MLRFKDLLHRLHAQAFSPSSSDMGQKLKDLRLVSYDGRLNLAGVVLFAERPELTLPHAVVVAIRYCDDTAYSESITAQQTITGPLCGIFADAKAFIMRHLHKVQAGRGVNAPGVSKIPVAAIDEILVNALVHRDYLLPEPLRVSIFENRIEVVSPGCLPADLGMEAFNAGKSALRNPLIASYAANGLLPFRGRGLGVKAALDCWSHITFVEEVEPCRFRVVIKRKSLNELCRLHAPLDV